MEAEAEPESLVRRPRGRRGFLLLCAVYFLALAILTGGNILGPERWWWSCFNLYLPQWIWGLPGLALCGIGLVAYRRLLWLPLLALLWVIGPIMGFCWHFGGGGKGEHLRVMTYNVKGGTHDQSAVFRDIEEYKPDLILMQEYRSLLDDNIKLHLPGWNTFRVGQYFIATRLPVSDLEQRPLVSEYTHGDLLRCKVSFAGRWITVYTVHFLSPRTGLNMLRHQKTDGIQDWEANFQGRLDQAKLMAEQIKGETDPVIATGDLNAPMQSLVCRELFDTGLKDAFAEAGRGFGYTYGHMMKTRHSFLRIDHILYNNNWQAGSSWTGNGEGSDHRPVFADLYLK